ncbi:sodium ion-translocating decarboxylase subunit beta, partial [Ectopseudomonas hydrolytica]
MLAGVRANALLEVALELFMIAVCLVLIYLAIKKGFEPLLLVPIGFGGL